jgi:rod shape-determining protein MreC
MESLLNRYRNITVLLLVIFAQLVLLAIQVKNGADVPLIRVWTVTAVTPVARLVEGLRGGGSGFLHNYVVLHDSSAENRRLRTELDQLKLDNIFLKNELNRADRAKALEVFQQHTASKMVAATIFMVGAVSNSKVVYVDRGTLSGVQRGMGVVTPDGIVGKVIAAYPTASEVLLVTDADFAAGVISQKNQAHGTLKGQGTPMCKMDYVAFEDKIEPDEMLFTSGDDRIFPRGFPVGVVKAVRPAQPFKEILVEPSGLQRGLEDVLIVVQAAHQAIPEAPPVSQPVYIAPAPPSSPGPAPGQAADPAPGTAGTEADKLRAIYKAAAAAQNHTFGEGGPGIRLPDFTRLPAPGATPNAAGAAPVPPSPKPLGAPPATPLTVTPGAARRSPQPAGIPPGGIPPGGPPH